MTYGAKVVIPLENGFPTIRTNTFTLDENDELLKKNLDLVEERREMQWCSWPITNTSLSKTMI